LVREVSMPVGAVKILDLLRESLVASGEARSVAVDGVTDWVQALDDYEVAVVSQVLIWLAIAEVDDSARESELHALAEFAEHDRLPGQLLAQIGGIPRGELQGSSLEHYDYLRSCE
jgi:hypothetical protein